MTKGQVLQKYWTVRDKVAKSKAVDKKAFVTELLTSLQPSRVVPFSKTDDWAKAVRAGTYQLGKLLKDDALDKKNGKETVDLSEVRFC